MNLLYSYWIQFEELEFCKLPHTAAFLGTKNSDVFVFWLLFVWTSRRKRVGWRRSGHSASKELEPVLDLVRPTQDRHGGAAKSILSLQNHFSLILKKAEHIFRCRCYFFLLDHQDLGQTIPSLQWCPFCAVATKTWTGCCWDRRQIGSGAVAPFLQPSNYSSLLQVTRGCSWRMWGYMVWAWNRVILMLRWLEINLCLFFTSKGDSHVKLFLQASQNSRRLLMDVCFFIFYSSSSLSAPNRIDRIDAKLVFESGAWGGKMWHVSTNTTWPGDSPLADSPKTNVSTVVPASPGSCEVVESPEKVNGEEVGTSPNWCFGDFRIWDCHLCI